MHKSINSTINNYIDLARNIYPNIEQVFLFGSYAKGNATENSDIDLALIFKNLDNNNRFDIQVQLMLIASQIDTRIEPHPISRKDFSSWKPLVIEIKKTGI